MKNLNILLLPLAILFLGYTSVAAIPPHPPKRCETTLMVWPDPDYLNHDQLTLHDPYAEAEIRVRHQISPNSPNLAEGGFNLVLLAQATTTLPKRVVKIPLETPIPFWTMRTIEKEKYALVEAAFRNSPPGQHLYIPRQIVEDMTSTDIDEGIDVREFIDGPTLGERITKLGYIPENTARIIAKLRSLHRQAKNSVVRRAGGAMTTACIREEYAEKKLNYRLLFNLLQMLIPKTDAYPMATLSQDYTMRVGIDPGFGFSNLRFQLNEDGSVSDRLYLVDP